MQQAMHQPDQPESVCIAKEPCPACGSRDNLGRYSDGHGFCFGCGHHERGTMNEQPVHAPLQREGSVGFLSGECEPLAKRGITAVTAAKFGYMVGDRNGARVHIAPYRRNGQVVSQHLRGAGKSFSWVGKPDGVELFGQHLWRDEGKKVVITEGEIDCLTVSQLQGNKWPVVSLPNGATSAAKYLRANLEWLERFETVVLMFDMDEPGKAAAAECAPLFTPGRCKVASLPMKDANEMLLAGRGSEVIDAIWAAKEYRPDGVLSVSDIRDAILRPLPPGDAWPFEEMTGWTHGRRPGEVYGFGAGTGVGKTDFFTQIIDYDTRVLGKKCGVIYLEQPPVETVRRIAGKSVGRIFHVPGGYTSDELAVAIDAIDARGNLYLLDQFGSADWDPIKAHIRFMVVGLGCEHIFLDHLTALVAQEGDVKAALDSIMADMAGMGKELGHKTHFISHLNTPEGKPHEEGGRVTIRNFLGSRAIGFWSHFMFGLERDQQHDDEAERNVTTLRCLKDRVTGAGTGKTMRLGYDRETGLLYPAGPAPTTFKDETRGSSNPDF